MSQINDLHEQAMEWADKAFIARRKGNKDLVQKYYRTAYELEMAAAELMKDDFSSEPTRSVLYRSAASLAMDAAEFRSAERLISSALAGNPPNEIADELRDLLEEVNFNRHLELRNIGLDRGGLQFSISGSAVGFGITLTEVFVERIKDIERLIYRTVERKLGKEFRERGSTNQSIQEGYSLYLSAPRAGSFTVTLRLGRQMELPGLDFSGEVIDEIIECFELLNKGKEETIKERIPEQPYFQNFIGLAKRIAPDGEKVRMVGLTAIKDGEEVKVALRRRREDISISLLKGDPIQVDRELVKVTGRLLLADARRAEGKIQLISDLGESFDVIVPEGMMNDIVKPLWDDVVVVTGIHVRSKIYLQEINSI